MHEPRIVWKKVNGELVELFVDGVEMSPREFEIVICSAVKTKEGGITRGHRHNDCIRTILEENANYSFKGAVQGFITSRNRFVDRKEGMELQKKAGIESVWDKGCNNGDILFSEDLY